jgi:Ser/Thr protein kinase RdoA (MazF antagonist)
MSVIRRGRAPQPAPAEEGLPPRWVADVIAAVAPYPLADAPEPLVAGAGPGAFTVELSTGDPFWSGPLVARIGEPVVLQWETAWIRAVAAPGFPVPEVVADRYDQGVVLFRLPAGTTLAGCMATDFMRMPHYLATLGQMHARLHAFPIAGDRSRPRALLPLPPPGGGDEDRWLAERRPSPAAGREVVCHGQLYPTNVYLDGDADPVAIDWTRACVGDPAYDVASTLVAFWVLPLYVDNAIQRKMVKMARDSLASSYLDAYRDAASSSGPLDEAALRYWQAHHLWQLAAEVNRRVTGDRLSAWSPAATIPDPAKSLDDLRTHFWELTDGQL